MRSDRKKIFLFNNPTYFAGIIFLSFALSWLSPLLSSLLIKNNIPEIFIFISFICLANSAKNIWSLILVTFNSKFFISVLVFSFLLLLLSLLKQNSEFGNAFGDFRSNISFIFFLQLFAYYFNWRKTENTHFLINLLVLISLMDLLALVLRPYIGIQDDNNVKQTISIIIPALLTIYFIRKKMLLKSLFFLCIVSYESIIGFFRNYYIIAIVVLFIILITLTEIILKKNKMSLKIKSLFFGVTIFISILFLSPRVYNYWDSDSSRSIHSINRTQEFFEDKNQEQERRNSINVVIEEPLLFVIPHGLGWRNFTKDIERDFSYYHIISSMDSCFFYVAFHYGLFSLLILILFFCKAIYSQFVNSKIWSNTFPIYIRMLLLVLFFSSFFTQSIMFTTIQAAFSYSLLFALVLNPIK